MWKKNPAIHIVGLALCACILTVTATKFGAGGRVTRADRIGDRLPAGEGPLPQTHDALARLERSSTPPMTDQERPVPEFDPTKPTAVLPVGSYNGLAIHSLLAHPAHVPTYSTTSCCFGGFSTPALQGVDGVMQLGRRCAAI